MTSHVSRRQLLMALAASGAMRGVARSPKRIASESGLLDVTLEAAQSWTETGERSAFLYTYNGQSPGPVLEVQPGDTLRITLVNRLPESTNLHFHGLHVSPSGNSDNVLIEIPPGESFLYEVQIPATHEPGLFWYHPHVHGSVARQVSSGLCGLIVIRGGLDYVPEIAAAREQLLVLQDFDLTAGGLPASPLGMMEIHRGREGPLLTANGWLNPAIAVARGGWLRLRVLNASASRFYLLKVEEHSLFRIGTDGGSLPRPVETEQLLLTPGERADLMLRADRPGDEFRVVNLPYNRFGGGPPGATAGTETLARIQYVDDSSASDAPPLPSSFRPIEALGNPSGMRVFRLNDMAMGMGMGAGAGMSAMTINGRAFDHHRIDTRVRLGDVEDWQIINDGTMDHPFHVHTNAFQILGRDGNPEAAWRDIVVVKPRSQETIRMRFDDFTGVAVYHCHILDHEDQGMMGTLEIA